MLTHTELLRTITSQLNSRPVDWDEVLDRFKRHPLIGQRTIGTNLLSETLSKIHLRVSLEQICAPFSDLVNFDPIADGSNTDNYVFRHQHGRLAVYRSDGSIYTVLDQLLLVDGLPVLFNMRTGSYSAAGSSSYTYQKRRQRESKQPGTKFKREFALVPDSELPESSHKARRRKSNITTYSMRDERINFLLDPVLEYCNIDSAGYVLIVFRDYYKPSSPLQQAFRGKNGLLLPFSYTRDAYRQTVARFAEVMNTI